MNLVKITNPKNKYERRYLLINKWENNVGIFLRKIIQIPGKIYLKIHKSQIDL